MAKVTKEKNIEETLWESAIKLRSTVEPSEYKHVVLWLIFLKFANDKFEERRKELRAEGKDKYLEMIEFYTMKNVFYLPEESRWSFLIANGKSQDLAIKIDTALYTLEKKNPALEWALPDNYYSRINLDVTKLASLLDTIDGINTIKDKENDIVWRVYEYFLRKFAIAEGKWKWEFYTPKCIVKLMTELIEPYKGNIYDPACGSGGMFVQSMKFISEHHWNSKEVSIHGQENIPATYKLAKMNLAIRWISANLWAMPADTFSKDQHKDLKADFIMANPPFNFKDWRWADELMDDPRWSGYDVPPASNANYAWILHIVSKLSDNGVGGFLLANGALSGGGEEYKIRKALIEKNLVEAIIIIPRDTFYSTDISVTLWIVNKDKKKKSILINDEIRSYRNRESEVLFMDLRRCWSEYEKGYIELTDSDIKKVVETYHGWQQTGVKSEYKNIPEFCYSASIDELREKDYSLVPSKYIEFVDRDSEVDFDKEMKRIQSDFRELIKDEKDSQQQLINAFKILGYEI